MRIDRDWQATIVGADGRESIFRLAEAHDWIAEIAAGLGGLAKGSVVGLIFRTQARLLASWFACIAAGMKPLIIQYPTSKLSRVYWLDSVTASIGTAGVGCILTDDAVADALTLVAIPVLRVGQRGGTQPGTVALPERFDIVQMSSGTTGHRKAISFSSENLARHLQDYNTVLQLDVQDCIVSWLPLYHDMGYIACFMTSLALNVKLVLIDPVDWVQTPALLFDAIRKHGGTICYMPNFGFEVMSRAANGKLATMRRWISCSEPVSAQTCARFTEAVGCAETAIGACYAMAENVFAVSLAMGIRTRSIGGVDVVSCGAPIPGVELHVRSGEFFIRSPTSLRAYEGGTEIADGEGFYASGDMGEIIDGEIYVAGRTQDVMIQAGRKFFLSDIDLRLAALDASFNGRAAALAVHDERLGTEMPLLLAEAEDFLTRGDANAIAAALAQSSGLDQMEVAFAPPLFITKTSSGKVNRRKTAADWMAALAARGEPGKEGDPEDELAATFERFDWRRPVGEVLDSLMMTVLRIVTDGAQVAFSPEMTLSQIRHALHRKRRAPAGEKAARKGIRIVSLADRRTIRRVKLHHLQLLGRVLGCEVTLEHICLPPSPILLSDYVFHRYFQPRLDQAHFGKVNAAMRALEEASVILVDDRSELFYLYELVYPALSHRLERNPDADLIALRWQNYTRQHHHLPITVAAGGQIPLEACNIAQKLLQAALNVPIFRIAALPGFGDVTQDWDVRNTDAAATEIAIDVLMDGLGAWLQARSSTLTRKALSTGSHLVRSDAPHFCAHMINQAVADAVTGRYDSFCVSGQPASAPYVRNRLAALGKRFVTVPSHSTGVVAALDPPVDCLLLCGSFGDLESDLPTVALQHIGTSWRIRNMTDPGFSSETINIIPRGATDWFHPYPLGQHQDRALWKAVRLEVKGRG